MNFDTPPQALTICGEWNKIFEDTRHKRQAAPDCLFARAYLARPGGAVRRGRKCTRRRLKEIMQTERIKK